MGDDQEARGPVLDKSASDVVDKYIHLVGTRIHTRAYTYIDVYIYIYRERESRYTHIYISIVLVLVLILKYGASVSVLTIIMIVVRTIILSLLLMIIMSKLLIFMIDNEMTWPIFQLRIYNFGVWVERIVKRRRRVFLARSLLP